MFDFLFCLSALIMGFIIFTIFCGQNSDSRRFGKRMYKKLCTIASAISYSKKDCLEITSMGEKFFVRVADEKVAPGIKYTTIPVYTCKNVYINDELVCKVHVLTGLFQKSYCTEYSHQREETEIDHLIKCAHKTAKQIDKDYWKDWLKRQENKKTFYNK